MRFCRLALIGLVVACASMAADLSRATTTINKQFTPATIDPGDVSRLRVSIFNSSLVSLTAAAVTDNLPAQVTIRSPANVTDTCGFGSVTATPATSRVIASSGTVPAGTGTLDGSCFIELDVVSTTSGNWPNTIPANGPSSGFTPGGTVSGYQATEGSVVVSNTTLATATLAVRSLNVPTGTKTFAPSPGLVTEPITLSIVLTNPNATSTIPLTSFTDPLPAGMVVASTPSPTISCTGAGAVNGAVTATAGASSVVLTGGTIGMGGTCTLTAKVVANTVTGTTQSFANLIPANAIGNIRGLTSATFNRTEVVNSPITLAKAFTTTVAGASIGATPIVAGKEIYARVDISNTSTTNALAITTFTDNLPAGLVVGNTLPSSIDCVTSGGGTNGVLTATPGATSFTLTGGSVGITGGTRRCRVAVAVVASAAGSYVNSIPVNAIGNAGGFGSPSASATLNVNSQLTVAKTVSSGNAAPGQPVTFTVTINNYSTGAVSGVAFTDTLPLVAGNQMVISSPNGFVTSAGCTGGSFVNAPGSSTLSWSGGGIVGGVGTSPGVCTITFKANAPLAASVGAIFTNTIGVGAITGTGPSGAVANTGATSVNVTMVAAATLAKAFAPASIVQNGVAVLTVTMANQTAAVLTNAALTDTLPANVTVGAVPGTSTTCAGGSVSATSLGATVGISGATIPANGSCNFKVNVTSAAVGAWINTIPAGALANDQASSNPASASATLTVTSGLTATKAFNPTSVANGGVSQVDVHIVNPSVITLTNLSVTDGPMNNLRVANPAVASTTCAGSPVITAVPGSATVTMTGANLAGGSNCDLLFNVVSSGNPANWPNTIPIGGITTAEGDRNTAAVSATLAKLTAVNIGINKSFNPVSVAGSQPSTLRIDLTNPISSVAPVHNLSFTDSLPAGMEVYPIPNVSTTCVNGTVTAVPDSAVVSLAGGTLGIGATCSVFVDVTSVQFLNLTNTIPIGAVSTQEGLTNSLATTATLSTLQGLGVAKGFSPTSVSIGQPSTLDLRLISTLDPTAPAPVTLHNVSFTDVLPAGVLVAATPNLATDCSDATLTALADTNTVTVTGVTLTPSTDCHVLVDVVASTLGALTNVIPAHAVVADEGYSNPGSASATLNVVNPPTIAKAFAPSPVLPGASSTLTITIANPNGIPLTTVGLTDTLPAGVAVALTPNASTTCTGGAVAAAAASTSITLTNGAVAANSSCTIAADVLSNTPSTYVNTIPADALTTAQGVTNVAPGSASLVVLGPPGVSKSFNPTTVALNATSQLTLTFTNGNPSATTLTSLFTDALPSGVAIASPNNLGGTCTLASVGAAAGGTSITYANGASVPATGCTIVVDVTGVSPGAAVNVIGAGALRTTAGNNPAPATATLTVQPPPQADVSVTKDDGLSSIENGFATTYTIVVTNNGPANADGTILKDPVAAGIAKTGVTCLAGGLAQCPPSPTLSALQGAGIVIPALPAASSVTFTVPATLTGSAGTTVTNVATVTVAAGIVDPTPGNNSAADVDTILGGPDLTVIKTHAGNFVAGSSGSFTLTVSNAGDVAATGLVTLADTLPVFLAGASLDGSGWTCDVATLTCTRGDALPAGASYPDVTLGVNVAGNATGTLVNQANVAGGSDVNPSNNSAQDSVSVLTLPDLALAKSHSGVIRTGGSATFQLAASNVGVSPVLAGTTVSVVDALPPGMTATAIGGSGWTCDLPSLACSRADGLAAGGASYPDIVVSVTVTAAAGAILTNSATVNVAADANPSNDTALDTVTVAGNPDWAISKSHSGSFVLGQGGGTFTLTVTNVGNAAGTGTVTVTDTMPAGLAATAIAGPGWTCTVTPLSCARSDGLPAGSSYPSIAVTVSVAPSATSPLVNSAAVSGAGDLNPSNDTGIDSVTLQSGVDLAIVKSHTGSFTPGQSGSFALTVSNVGTSPTTGSVTVNDTLPAGLSAQTLSGGGWTCTNAPLSCNRADALAAGASYPPITLTVAVDGSIAATTVTNRADVTSVGDTSPANDSAADPVIVNGVPDLAISKSSSGVFVRGQSTGTFTLSVANAGSAPTSGLVTVDDAMPLGLAAVAIDGPGWTCSLAPPGCTRSDVLAPGAAYPDIAITVATAANAPASLTNSASVDTPGDINAANDTASAQVTVYNGVDLTIAKTHSGNFLRGGSGTFVLAVGNAGDQPAVGTVVVDDVLPPGLTATGVSGNGWACTLAPLSCSRADGLGAGLGYPDITIAVDVAPNAAASLTNTATVGASGDNNPGNNAASDTVLPIGNPDLSIVKSHLGNFTRGETGASFAIAVTNVGTSATTGVVTVTDALPAGLVATAIGGSGWTCSTTPLACARSDALAVGASYPSIAVTVDVSLTAGNPLVNVANVSTLNDPNAANDTSSDVVTVNLGADLTLAKTHSGAFVRGQPGTFTLTVANIGDQPTSGLVTVTDTGATGFTIVSLTGTGWSCTNPPAQCTRSDALAPIASYPAITVNVAVDANATSPIVNAATVAGGADTNPTNNAASDSVALGGTPDVAIAKTHAGNFVRGQPGGTFTLAISNAGDSPTFAPVTVTDALPAGLTANSVNGAGWNCTLAPVACSRSDSLPNGEAFPPITVAVDVSASAATPLVNVATASTAGDANPGNDTASDTVTLSAGPDLAITKTHAGVFISGQAAAFTLTVTNVGDLPTSGTVGVSDALPAGLAASGIAGSGWTCTVSPLACSRSDALAPGASFPAITLSVDVASSAIGIVTNAATVAGGGDGNPANNSAVDVATVVAGPSLRIAKAHGGSFVRGQIGALYAITVTNDGASPTSGEVSVVDFLPAGLTATAMAGNGWICVLASLTCTRSDALSPGADFPTIAVTVNVAADAPPTLVNVANAAGGGAPPALVISTSDVTVVVLGASRIPTMTEGVLALLALLIAVIGGLAMRRAAPNRRW